MEHTGFEPVASTLPVWIFCSSCFWCGDEMPCFQGFQRFADFARIMFWVLFFPSSTQIVPKSTQVLWYLGSPCDTVQHISGGLVCFLYSMGVYVQCYGRPAVPQALWYCGNVGMLSSHVCGKCCCAFQYKRFKLSLERPSFFGICFD